MLKALAGNWVRVGENGQPSEQVVSTYRVTAAGSAVEEVLFPGTDHEMVTMYHQDGDNLLLTHYCAAGNQPRMKARNGTNPGELVFEFMDATNLRSPADPHMHAGTITIVDADHLRRSGKGTRTGNRATWPRSTWCGRNRSGVRVCVARSILLTVLCWGQRTE